MTAAPEMYLKVAVPEHIREVWRTWAGVEWRVTQHANRGNFSPPDQRFGVNIPAGMCGVHRRMWLDYRDKRFNPATGQRWPGVGLFGHLDPGGITAHNGDAKLRLLEERRCEWDVRASEAMQGVESCCLSRRSTQCSDRLEAAA